MKKRLKILVWALFLGIAALAMGIFFLLWGSMPILTGERELIQLSSPATVDRDEFGIPSIHAATRADAARALGFVHAQDRFFQMDLMRRAAAGELSELFGKEALEFDKSRRWHRFKIRATQLLTQLTQAEQSLLQSYAEGVNAGLNALVTLPFEYWLLQMTPTLWKPEDSLLVCFGLFFELQDGTGEGAINRWLMQHFLPEEVFNFFKNNGSVWEAALDHTHTPLIAVPGPEAFYYLNESKKNLAQAITLEPQLGGSNQWAVTKNRTKHGKALLACDMHLALGVPNIWYRAALYYSDHGKTVQVFGATLPGTPLVIIGSNTHIAWGFTNGYVRTNALVDADEGSIEYVTETIAVKDEESFLFEFKTSPQGPVLSRSFFHKPMALSWVAYDPEALNMRLFHLEQAKDVYEALDIVKTVKVPVVNFLVVDNQSNLAWTLMGKILDLNSEEYPVIINPENHQLWTANNRMLGGKWLKSLGDGNFLNGIRAYHIHQGLQVMQYAEEEDQLALQLQTHAIFFERWQQLLSEVLRGSPYSEKRQELLKVISSWDQQCTENSAAYYWIRQFRERISLAILQRILAPCLQAFPGFLDLYQDFEEPVWLIIQQRPSYLLDPQFTSWDHEFLFSIDQILQEVSIGEISSQTWGKHNRLNMRHPFSHAFPWLEYLLDMPAVPMSGDFYVPKVSYRHEGASQRMVVSPGHEEEGIFHMPGGQSAHPLSPFYRAGHHAWLKGEATPFLPSTPVYTLTLLPGKGK